MVKKLFLFVFTFALVNSSYAYQKHTNVYFDFGSVDVSSASINLNNYSSGEVFFLKGFSDPTGSSAYNLMLSKKRAESVRRKLIKDFDLEPERVKIKSYGEDVSAALPREKRRVEILSGPVNEMTVLAQKKYQYSPDVVTSSEASPLQHKTEQTQAYKVEDAPSVKTASKFKLKHRHMIGAGLYYNTLLSQDKESLQEAEWISNENFNAEAQFQIKVQKLWLGLKAAYHVQDYRAPESTVFTWSGEDPNLASFSLVSDYELSRWGFGLDLDYREVPFVFESSSQIDLRKVFMFGVSLRGQYKIFQTSAWSSRLGFKLEYPISGSDDIEPKGDLGYIGFIDIRNEDFFLKYGLNAKIFYGIKNYSNIQNEQEERVAGLMLSLTSLENWL